MALIKTDFIVKRDRNNRPYKYFKSLCDLCDKDLGYRQPNQNTKCKECFSALKRASCLEIAKEFALKKGGECISTNYIGAESNLEWRCSCGFQWSARFSNVVNTGTWCPECADTGNNKRFSIQHAVEIASKNGGKCLSTEYKSARVPLVWQCSKEHIFSNALCNVKAGSWCPRCLNKTEQKVREIFQSLFNKQFPSVRPDFLKNPNTGFNLELDGYNEELKVAFEYDGQWHYIEHFADSNLEQRKKRDAIKNELCLQHNITLYRIPYTTKDSLKEFILNLVESNHTQEM